MSAQEPSLTASGELRVANHEAPAATSAHTPGPWCVESGDIWSGQNGDSADIPLFRVDRRPRSWGRPYSDEEQAANARLIAAAPDLLAAIKSTRALVAAGADSGFTDHDWMQRLFENQAALTAAMAKAEASS